MEVRVVVRAVLLATLCWTSVRQVPAAGPNSVGDEPAATTVAIELTDGRRLRGVVDARTTREMLWLRRVESSIVMRTGTHWYDIATLEVGSDLLTPEEGRERLLPHASALPPQSTIDFWAFPAAPDHFGEPLVEGAFMAERSTVPAVLVPAASVIVPPARPVTLRLEASLGNWDADPEADGLWVSVAPLDAAGQLVPVNGHVQFTVIGERVQYRQHHDGRRHELFPEIARSGERVRTTDFMAIDGNMRSAVYRIPFRNRHPEYDFEVAPWVVVTARLGVPGQGVLQASTDDVNVRPPSWIRDRAQQIRGMRYFPQERAGVGR